MSRHRIYLHDFFSHYTISCFRFFLSKFIAQGHDDLSEITTGTHILILGKGTRHGAYGQELNQRYQFGIVNGTGFWAFGTEHGMETELDRGDPANVSFI